MRRNISITPETDKLIRDHVRQKGDYSQYVSEAVKEKSERDAQKPC